MPAQAVPEQLPGSISDSFDSDSKRQEKKELVFCPQPAQLSEEKTCRPRRRKSSVARLEFREASAAAHLEKRDEELAGPSAPRRDQRPAKPVIRKVQSRELDFPEATQDRNKLTVRPMEESWVVSRLHDDLDEGSREDLDSASPKRHVIAIPVPHSRAKDKAAEYSQNPDESPSTKNGRKDFDSAVSLDGMNPKTLASLLGESLQDRLYLKSKLKKIDKTIETLKKSMLQQPHNSINEIKRARRSPAGETKDSLTSGHAGRELKTSKDARDILILRSSKSPTGSGRSDFLADSKPYQLLRECQLVRGSTKQTDPLSSSFVLPDQSRQNKAVSKRNQLFTLRKKHHFIIPADRDRDPPKRRRGPARPQPGRPPLFRPSSFDGRSVSVQPSEPGRPRPALKGWSVRTGTFFPRQSVGSRRESPTKEQFIID